MTHKAASPYTLCSVFTGDTLKWKAKSRNDGNAYELATNMELRSCNMLEKINQT